MEVGGSSAEMLAAYLLGLGTPLRVLAPDSVREALLRLTREVLAANEDAST